jgi:hypothetical protein
MGKPQGMRSHRRCWCTSEHNIKIHLKQTGWEGGGLATSGSEYRKESGLCGHSNEPSVFVKCAELAN